MTIRIPKGVLIGLGILIIAGVGVAGVLALADGGGSDSGGDGERVKEESVDQSCLRSWNGAIEANLEPVNQLGIVSFINSGIIAGDVFVGPYEGPPLAYGSEQGVINAGDCWLVWPVSRLSSRGIFFISGADGWKEAAASPGDFGELVAEIDEAAAKPNASVVFAGLPVDAYPENGTLLALDQADGEPTIDGGSPGEAAGADGADEGGSCPEPTTLGQWNDNVSDVSAEGLSCAEAEAELKRMVDSRSLDSIPGWGCERTDAGYESGLIRCTRGSEEISFASGV